MADDNVPVPDGIEAGAWGDALDAVRDYCGWHIAPPRTETVRLDGPGGGLLHLPSLHVTDIVSITSDGQAVTDYQWSQFGMVSASWSSKLGGIGATFTHGFDKLPGVVVAVARSLALAPDLPARQETVGPFSVMWGDTTSTLSAVQEAALAPYRIGHRP